MSASTITINGKTVRLSLPVVIPESGIVGREREMNKVLACWLKCDDDIPLSPLLIGAPGVGKNKIVYASSRICASELYIFQGHEDITAEDLFCSVRISDDREQQMDYIMSPLVTAMIRGGICFIDEIGKIRARALAPLASLLDERRYLDSNLLGERIHAHPGFRLIAATNTSDMEQSRLPDFLASRMRPVITIGYPDRKEVDTIITQHFSVQAKDHYADFLDLFWTLWRKCYKDKPPTPRDSLQIFGYAKKLADFESTGSSRPLSLTVSTQGPLMSEKHLSQAFEAFSGHIQESEA
ncbi:MAG: AAA family ATPase [Smithella sp.]